MEVYGYTTVPSGRITKIIPSPEARSKNIKTRLQEESGVAADTVITQIIPLRYADPTEIKALFTPLVSKNSVIQAYAPTNTLIITDVHSNIKRLLRILKAIDITGVGQQIAIIPVENASAAKMVSLLQAIFKPTGKGKRTSTSSVTFVADERTNAIVVLASEGEVDNIRQLVRNLDEDTPKGQGNINVYYLEHATAEDLVKVLQDIPQKGSDTTKGGKTVQPVVSKDVRITADKATNSLIITAEPDDYLVLEAIIRKVDIPRAMVYIEALIMEVNVTKDFELGTEWIIGNEASHDGKDIAVGGGFAGEDSIIGGTTTSDGTLVPSLPSGMALGLFGEALNISGIYFPSIQAVINAYKKDRDVRILSTPQILTTDNQEAKIYVGKNIPFQTTATLSTSSAGEVYNSFEYRDVGKTLKITPQISKDRMVRLLLSLEITALESNADNRPITLKRTIETTAIVHDGHSVVLGGLIDDTQGATVYKTPCLGDIPGLGFLFSTRSTAFEKSNLYVFLTPRVIQSPGEIEKVSTTKRTEIENLRSKSIDLDKNKDAPPLEELQVPATEGGEMDDAVDPQEMPQQHSDTTQGSGENSKQATPDVKYGSADGSAAPQTTQRAKDMEKEMVSADRTSETVTDKTPQYVSPQTAGTTAAETTGPGAASPTVAEGSSGIEGYTLQVASIQDPTKAKLLLLELTGRGYAAYTVRSEVEGKIWYRLRIGYFANQDAAKKVIEKLKADQYTPILVKL